VINKMGNAIIFWLMGFVIYVYLMLEPLIFYWHKIGITIMLLFFVVSNFGFSCCGHNLDL
jgi:hypothetical protein